MRPLSRPYSTRRLICLSFCGGGTAPFHVWQPAVPGDVELVLLCYPGREVRQESPLPTAWDALVEDAMQAVLSLDRRPFVLFGHGMGAWVAFEVAAALERTTAVPHGVVASAALAPTQ